ncbi:MAG: hypothetical protein LWX11_04080, partial [Firmicutes bacterium]|nr:hypothetical protein [Bacillota bacterium]
MYDIERSLDQQILASSKSRPTAVFVEPTDPRVLEAVCHLTRFVRPVFLASEAAVREVADQYLQHVDPDRLSWAFSESAFVEIDKRPDLVEEFAQGYRELLREKGEDIDLNEARIRVSKPGLFGICAVKFNHADTVVGGADHEAREFFRPMVKLLSKDPLVCEAGVFVLPDEHPSDIFPHNIVVFG